MKARRRSLSKLYSQFGKRILDLVVVTVVLVVLSPVLLSIGILLFLSNGKPILFLQHRPGLYGQSFQLLKFRTMTITYDNAGRLLPDRDRLTRIGRILRHTSVDELPELVNVLRGEMSLVGPRPLLMQYLDRYTPEQARRHDVKPGITGWAQVNGRNALTWEEKFELDVWYVDNMSLLLDLKILFLTLLTVVRRENILHEGHATMPEFMGSDPSSTDK